MKPPMSRLLRLRQLLEDLSRLDFEEKSAAMCNLEEAARQHRQTAVSLCTEAFGALSVTEPATPGFRSVRMADTGIAVWKEAKLGALVEAGKPAVNRARDALLIRRMERLQVEMLQAAAERAEKRALARREQNRTDDWFQSRPGRGPRQRG
jgi:hypothetical protein